MFIAAEKRSSDDEVSKTGDGAPLGRDVCVRVTMWMHLRATVTMRMHLRATHNYMNGHCCLKPRVASFQCNGGLTKKFKKELNRKPLQANAAETHQTLAPDINGHVLNNSRRHCKQPSIKQYGKKTTELSRTACLRMDRFAQIHRSRQDAAARRLRAKAVRPANPEE